MPTITADIAALLAALLAALDAGDDGVLPILADLIEEGDLFDHLRALRWTVPAQPVASRIGNLLVVLRDRGHAARCNLRP